MKLKKLINIKETMNKIKNISDFVEINFPEIKQTNRVKLSYLLASLGLGDIECQNLYYVPNEQGAITVQIFQERFLGNKDNSIGIRNLADELSDCNLNLKTIK